MTKTSRSGIVAAARDLMRDKGYARTSMKEVADRVGLLKGSLYSHFATKEDLVPEVLALTLREALDGIPPGSDWRRTYATALERLVQLLTANRRCIGLQLAYGFDAASAAPHQAVTQFFLDLCSFLEKALAPGMDADLAQDFARDTITALEGATLWLVLDNNNQPMQAARRALLARADSFAAKPPEEAARRILDTMVGDWRRSSLAEKALASRIAIAEERLAGLESEDCTRPPHQS
ncbi:MAG: TetR/AcrR family transcriptional regulator [Alphaproteobacteria bacterium]|nr:TetR/AcrR family transcriptional regulator [Alphaproteobacteria bacterium]